MSLTILRGPAGAGKSQVIAGRLRPGQVVIDFSRLYVALSGVERGPDGRYPVRQSGDPRLALSEYMRLTAIREASQRELSGYVTTSDSRPEAVERLQSAGADGPVETIDPGEATVRARLANAATGELSAECAQAMARWFGGGESTSLDPTAGPRASASVAAELQRVRRRR